MQRININGLAQRQLKAELALADTKHKRVESRKNSKERRKAYLDGSHIFTMYLDEKYTGIKRTMTGREAKFANDMSVQKFIAKESSKICRWSAKHRDNPHL